MQVFCIVLSSIHSFSFNQNTPVKSAAVPPARDKVDAWDEKTGKCGWKKAQDWLPQRIPCLKFADLQSLGNDVAFIACSKGKLSIQVAIMDILDSQIGLALKVSKGYTFMTLTYIQRISTA